MRARIALGSRLHAKGTMHGKMHTPKSAIHAHVASIFPLNPRRVERKNGS